MSKQPERPVNKYQLGAPLNVSEDRENIAGANSCSVYVS